MKTDILLNIDNPRQLEKSYKANKPTFKQACKALYPLVSGQKPLYSRRSVPGMASGYSFYQSFVFLVSSLRVLRDPL